MLTFLCQQESA